MAPIIVRREAPICRRAPIRASEKSQGPIPVGDRPSHLLPGRRLLGGRRGLRALGGGHRAVLLGLVGLLARSHLGALLVLALLLGDLVGGLGLHLLDVLLVLVIGVLLVVELFLGDLLGGLGLGLADVARVVLHRLALLLRRLGVGLDAVLLALVFVVRDALGLVL